MLPSYWLAFLERNKLKAGDAFSIGADLDRSGVGADLELFDEAASHEEAIEFYPGIALAGDGYVPVAQCLIGSGDPYFINVNDGAAGPLYRAYHDEVSATGYDKARAIAVVLSSYEKLVDFKDVDDAE